MFPDIQNNTAPAQIADRGSTDKSQQPKETNLQDFQSNIFEKYKAHISEGKAQEIFNNNDVNHSGGLDDAEKTKAMADVSAYITSVIRNAATGGQSRTDQLGEQARQGAVEFNQMTPQQQAQDVVADLKALAAKGADVSVQNGQIMFDGQPVDLKSLGASDEAIELIKSEIEKFAAEQTSRSQDE